MKLFQQLLVALQLLACWPRALTPPTSMLMRWPSMPSNKKEQVTSITQFSDVTQPTGLTRL